MLKEDLRLVFKSKRNSLSEQDSEELSLQIANRSLNMNIWNHSNYHIFFPIEKTLYIYISIYVPLISEKSIWKNPVQPTGFLVYSKASLLSYPY